VLALLFVAFLLALLIGFDVGFSMIFRRGWGSWPSRRDDRHRHDALSMMAGVDSYLVQVPLFILAAS
jgi:hypothetical protein